MGRRGPAPMPTKIKLLLGETRPSRLNHLEPLPSRDVPKMPVGMSTLSRRVWHRLLRDYGQSGVLTSVDADSLRIYCECVVRYEHAATMLEKAGPLTRGQKGELVKNPLHQVVRDDADLIRAFAREFGFTPSARAGLRIEREHAMAQVDPDLGLPPRLRAVGNGD